MGCGNEKKESTFEKFSKKEKLFKPTLHPPKKRNKNDDKFSFSEQKKKMEVYTAQISVHGCREGPRRHPLKFQMHRPQAVSSG